MNQHHYVIIMAGGVGTRFWPYSRTAKPKQFQDILGTGQSLIQVTLGRFDDVCPLSNVYVVTNQDYLGLVQAQLPGLAPEQILLEPFMRNTAPCVAYAAYKIRQKDPQANIVVAPADHVILKEKLFSQTLLAALELTARQPAIVTLGIRPTRPDTGYGYIKMSGQPAPGQACPVHSFTEKPNLELAQQFVASGDYLWNAGLFVFSADTIINSFARLMPELHTAFSAIATRFYTPDEPAAVHQVYGQVASVSIDYGIMEKADNVYVIPCDPGWSDLGTWKSMYEYSEKDESGNATGGNPLVLAYETTNTIVKTPADRLVVVQGLDNYIVVEYGNALLICQKDQEQRIKIFLEEAKRQHGERFA
ncbi:MAG: mannose-1-phosphate guanylyltransferase [Bernardetiaceae bacterium]|nr:mannose-1-phosphate guanylyltransferase [Bernardetiaceae bacterium]